MELTKKVPDKFQSTPSARRATGKERAELAFTGISIHALREEGDPTARTKSRPGINFNPRPPRGGRQAIKVTSGYRCVFQSTPSARRATFQ